MEIQRAKLHVCDGRIVHVGELEPRYAQDTDEETGEPIGDPYEVDPLPEGTVVIVDGEYCVTANGRIVLPTDYRALRRAEYPPIE
jgi:hypothetical protein